MSLRTLTAKQAASLLLAQKDILGISRLANLGPFVSLNTRVVQAVRVTLVKGQVSATTGKGWTLWQALCGALGEALERYCAAHPPAFNESHYSAVPRVPLANWGHPSNFMPRDVCLAHELLSDQPCLLPAVDVHFPYHGPDLGHTSVHPHTSGLASGATLAEATLFGLFEVVERHASSRFFSRFQRETTGALIHVSTIEHPTITAALVDLQKKGYDILLFRINTLLPAYYVAILDANNLGPKFMVSGVCAHIDEHHALEGALLEAMQAIVIAAQGAREDLIRLSTSYQKQRLGKHHPFYRIREILARMNPTLTFPASARATGRTAADILPHFLTYLRAAGIREVYRCDLSHTHLPLHAVKLVVPGLFDTHINPLKRNHAIPTS
ncbi:YcaO-like family protein [Burkholderia cenocepacia]|uniref:YcaO-like family protein n=1 Tax=Burkholderia cenocepacia TaxID=95486 RepID=UPI000F58F2ED|nr:YcaO-like family protein [Burkholderia cenocepacia]RQU50043.1 hypothetical protein DF143_36570 [Burkholderia cenocepacia]RQV33875.1 hypothetical protein DF033_34015 [Burkholderia cenocepacia]